MVAHRAVVIAMLIHGLIGLGFEARARTLADIDLPQAVANAGSRQNKSVALRALAKSQWRLNDFAACIALIDENWKNVESAEALLELLPLASTFVALDAAQLSEIVSSVAETPAAATRPRLTATIAMMCLAAEGDATNAAMRTCAYRPRLIRRRTAAPTSHGPTPAEHGRRRPVAHPNGRAVL